MSNNGVLYYRKNYNQQTGEVENSPFVFSTILKSTIDKTHFSEGTQNFWLKTTYPGMLVGSGYTHAAKKDEHASKIGFFFDHTTGMPIIPGSSVKGVLRSVFPNININKKQDKGLIRTKVLWISKLVSKLNEDNFLKQEIFLSETDANIGTDKYKDEVDFINKIEEALFDKMDIDFLDAFPVVINGNNQGNTQKLFGEDYITPHIREGFTYEESMLKNPDPLKFLKVMPNVVFQFNFNLKEIILEKTKLSVEQIKLLFQKILLTIGVGAKTNVGYGQFEVANKPTNTTNTTHQENSNLEIVTRTTSGLVLKLGARKVVEENAPILQPIEQVTTPDPTPVIIKEIANPLVEELIVTPEMVEPSQPVITTKWELLKKDSIVEAKIIERKSGVAKVKIDLERNIVFLNIQGKAPTDDKVLVKITEISGKHEKGNFSVTKAKFYP